MEVSITQNSAQEWLQQEILRNDVGTVSGHANQITTGAVRELNGVNVTGGADNISDVGDGGTRGGTEVENLGTRLDVDLIETTEHTSSKL